ncbi:MAG: hypothetical protein ACOCUO_00400 [archaeon]
MTHNCEQCNNLLNGGYPCDRCHYDPMDDGKPFAFDGGRQIECWEVPDHLEAALEKTDSDEIRYHIRSALQHEACLRGEVDWTGNHEPANGGFLR